ncbi:MAG: ion channel [Candidatus Tumulicola sp.]
MWLWSAALVFVTISLHVAGITAITRGLRTFWSDDVDRRFTYLASSPGVIGIIVAAALTLAVLHGIECIAWAGAYLKTGALATSSDAMLYSVGSMTTRGASDLTPKPEWRLMGAIEAGDGMLLFGLSTAFLFSVMLRLWRMSSPLSLQPRRGQARAQRDREPSNDA